MATSNKIRALNRIPYDFEDGIKIKGTDVTDLRYIFTATGADYIGHDNGVISDVLDTVRPIADYAQLRAYNGSATQIRITQPGIEGFFYYDASDATSDDNGGTIIVAGTKRWKRHYFGNLNVKWFGAKGDGIADDSPPFQSAVDYAIYSGVRSVFIPFSAKERYRLSSLVAIASHGFTFIGDTAPIYTPEEGGYIFGDASVIDLFDYGNGPPDYGTYFGPNQLVFENIAFFSSTGFTQNAIRYTLVNGSPRGVVFRQCAAKGFVNILLPDNPTDSIAASSITVESCFFSGNTNTIDSVDVSGSLRYVGNYSAEGAKIKGRYSSGITISDNDFSWQANPIDLELSGNASVSIENNVFDSVDGDYVVRVRGTNNNSFVDLRPNRISSVTAVDQVRLENVVRVNEDITATIAGSIWGRRANITAIQAYFCPGSDVSGRMYIGGGVTEGAQGFTNPMRVAGALPSTATTKQDLGTVSMQTPFGETKTGISINGYPAAYISLEKIWFAGDALICCALVRVEEGEQPYFNMYNETYAEPGISCGQQTIPSIYADDWFLMFSVEIASVGGTTARFRFGSNGTDVGSSYSNLHVAAVGVHVVNAGAFEEHGPGLVRVPIKLFNPFIANKPLETVSIYDPGSLVDGAGVSVTIGVPGAALGDFAQASFSQSLQGILMTAVVSNTNEVTVRLQNETSGTIDLTSGTLRVRVNKA